MSHPMPNSREQFEAKFAPLGYTFGIDEDDGEYLFADTHHAWLGWQAGAQAENERLAELADNRPENMFTLNAYEIRNGDRGIT